MSEAALLDTLLSRHAARLAVVDAATGRTWTYADLDRRAEQCARVLREHGVTRGAHVTWTSWNRGEFVEVLWACLRLGATLVPLNPGGTTWERRRQLALLAPALSIDGVPARDDEAARMRIPRIHLLDDGPRGYHARLSAGSSRGRTSDGTPDAIGAVLFTSGSTARPRGARLPQRMLLRNAIASVEAWEWTPSTVAAIVSPLWHAGGFGAMLLPTLAAGGTVVVLPGFDPHTFWATLRSHGVTTLFGVPTLWQRALDAPGAAAAAGHGVQWLLSGGAPLPRRLHDRYGAIGLSLRQGLGMTEAGINLCTPTPLDVHEAPTSVGRPVPDIGVEIREWQPDSPEASAASPHAAGEAARTDAGELVVSGPCVAAGYVGPDDDHDTFLPDGRVRTGDLVRRDEAGRLHVVGRRKQVFSTSGFSVSPAEIELALHESADLADAVVVPVPDEARGEVGHAFVVPARGRAIDAEMLRAALRDRLSGYKVPARIHVVHDLPRTSSGKVDRAALQRTP